MLNLLFMRHSAKSHSNMSSVPSTRTVKLDGDLQYGQPVKVPQAIAHRGYKAKYPENSMIAFRAAVDIGAHALETDLHLSQDGVVVLSHVRYSAFWAN